MPGEPLPPNKYSGLEEDAYNTCLYLERLLDWSEEISDEVRTSKRTPQLCGRLLGYMMLEAPTPEGRLNVAKEIQTCASASDTQDRLAGITQFYDHHFIRFFKAAKDATPAVSTPPSRPSIDMTAEEKNQLLEEAPQDHRAAKLLCLVRDNYRCVVTGRYDAATAISRYLEDKTFIAPAPIVPTELAHIIAESTNANIQGGGTKRSYAASAWAVLDRFGKVNVVDNELNGQGIHRLPNVLTMSVDVHIYFDTLQIWFEEIGTDRYRLCAHWDSVLTALGVDLNNPVIQLTTTNASLPLPDSRLLRLHATCAKVAHLSGAGEYIDATLRDMEELKVLASDGGSAHVLLDALLHSGGQVTVH
ncbi:hypothetical protein SCP_1202040 [Sparassis crispa]|uniref:HNH nuclease domain-containing protein n=1 Tax=Sparassis crispa TaxID=139825 RepID=A0A401H0P1_9APHY|nr:hypothetical protein SCP_1202040 [Sparassis crispa]GBE87978.1 hypothetical protein SCP_1202040 [Sparassis crispa]